MALFLALNLVWFSGSSTFSLTPNGTQCPTASVQSVRIAVFDCCKKLIGYQIREVRPGDQGFLQCRCSEKSQLQQKLVLDPKVDLGLSVEQPASSITRAKVVHKEFPPRLLAEEQTIPEPPSLPPLSA